MHTQKSLVEFYYLLARKEKNEREAWAISSARKCYVFCPNWIFCNCLDVVQQFFFKWNIFKSGWNQGCRLKEKVACIQSQKPFVINLYPEA